MGIVRLSFALTRSCLGRILLFVCLTALLCVTAGLLGSFLLYGEQSVEPVTVALVDEDGSMESRMLLGYLEDLEDYRKILVFERTDRAEADAMLGRGKASAVIVVPKGFMSGVMEGSNQPFTVTLNAAAPMKAGLIRLFAQVYADMLRTGQQGVYTALDAAREYGSGEQRQEMFRAANTRFLSAMLNRKSVKEDRTASVTGESGAALHYGTAAFVFLMLLGSSLFLDLWARAASRPVLLRLSAMGIGPARAGLCYLAGAAVPFGAACLPPALGVWGANLLFGLELKGSAALLLALLSLILCGAAFLTAVSRLFGGGPGGCVFVFLYGLACLFLSGGVLPEAFLAPALAALGRFTPHYWLGRLLSRGLGGAVDTAALAAVAAFTAFFALAALAGIIRDGRVGRQP